MKSISFLLFSLLLSFTSLAIAPITGTTHFCFGSSTTLSDATTGGVWSSGNTAIATINSSGHVSGVTPGTTTISYTIVGTGSVSTIVTINSLPAVYTMTGGGSYCAGDSGVHVGLLNSQIGVNYFLQYGATSTGPFAGTGGPRDFGLQTAAGVYTVLATNAATSCSSNMSGAVIVTIIPTVPVAVSISVSPGDTVCSGTSVIFEATTANGGTTPTYVWTVDNVHVGGDSSTYTYVPANGDVVMITFTSSAACASPDTVSAADTMTVITRVIPSVSISATPGTEICLGINALLTAMPVFGGPAPAYAWTKNGAYVATGSAYTFLPVNGDTIHCRMISDYRCLLADTAFSAKTTMIVDTPVTPYLAINTSPGTILLPGQSDTLTAVLTGGGSSPTFEWIVNNTVVSGDNTDTYISNHFSAPYPDSITCIATSSTACALSTYTWVYIVVNSLGVNSVGTSETLNIYPNPNNGAFTIRGAFAGSPDEEVSIGITDVLGRIVYEGKATQVNGQINAKVALDATPADGIYLLTLHSGSDRRSYRISIGN